MTVALCAIFFVSGAAALLFETLWFREAGLLLGNSVWTSVLVTASFMAGLALGNGYAIRFGLRLARPLRTYARLETLIAATGVGLVLGIPHLVPVLAPVLTRLGAAALLDPGRAIGAFLLLVVPSSAMGATLPILTRSLAARDPNFGRVLGRLYGWNTLGAVAGALVGEAFLIRLLGVKGTAIAAAALNLSAALGAVLLDRRQAPLSVSAPAPSAPTSRRALGITTSTFVAGGLLLALEVVWFRLLLLFVVATTITFAVMLAVVLLGIAVGGLLASAWLARAPHAHRHAPLVALFAGGAVAVTYASLDHALGPLASPLIGGWGGVLSISLALMLPVCVASGVLFTLLGRALHAEVGEETRAAGQLTLANTLGGMLGSIAAGFVLLPLVGIERSLALVAAAYAVVAFFVPGAADPGREQWARFGAWGLFALVLALFPFGLMSTRYARRVGERWRSEGSRVAAMKEGLTETVFILRRDVLGAPLAWRLVTNGMGMSTTDHIAHRYMGLYVWWPAAVHPGLRSALVISYGLGTTARSLVETREIERIDVVDVSADVLRMSAVVWPQPADNPLRDPRVTTHAEDGRFFLLTTPQRYDLITGEPPPPKSAGIVNLYSQEYFALMRAKLTEGGMVTYWLPVLHLRPSESLAVIKAFCNVFEDCSLWSGFGHEWMLAGTRGATGPVSPERFARQWSDPVVAARLRDAGLESPAELGATFLADAETLGRLARDTPPLEDDHPYRLHPADLGPFPSPLYEKIMQIGDRARGFEASSLVRRLWPREWTGRTLAAFGQEAILNRFAWRHEGVAPPTTVADLEAALRAAAPVSVVLWYLGSSAEEQSIADRLADRADLPELFEIRGVGALARHDYEAAEALLAQAEPHAGERAPRLREWRELARRLEETAGGSGSGSALRP